MSAATVPRPSPASPRRGLLDALLMGVLVYAVYAKTPLGAIAETAVNVARGQKERPSWLATFKGRETEVRLPEQTVADATAASGSLPAPIAAAAAAHKVDPEALAALFSADGACSSTSCEMAAPPRAAVVVSALAGKTRLTPDEAARAIAAGQQELEGDTGLAIESLWLGTIPVELAVQQARRSSLPDPLDVETHAAFLSPSARRGPLQSALSVLAIHRLRTLAWPVDPGFPITSPFGERIHPVTGLQSFHNGTDVGTPVGTPLHAAHKGRIKRQSQDSVSGIYAVVDHGLGLETTYCHMSAADVVEGGRVQRRDVIGRSGSTGRVTGPHLHYIVRVRANAVDPEKFGESPTKTGGLEVPTPLPAAAPPQKSSQKTPQKPPQEEAEGAPK